jgi:DNA-binding protein HU-beta
MNHKELISELAEASETDSKTAAAVLSALTDLLLERVGAGEVVTIPRLAKFSLVDRAARVGRNPQTGEQLAIPAKRVAKITPTKTYKELAQRPL